MGVLERIGLQFQVPHVKSLEFVTPILTIEFTEQTAALNTNGQIRESQPSGSRSPDAEAEKELVLVKTL